MDFSEAMKLLETGTSVQRECWRQHTHLKIVEGRLCFFSKAGIANPLVSFSVEHMLAKDWVIYTGT